MSGEAYHPKACIRNVAVDQKVGQGKLQKSGTFFHEAATEPTIAYVCSISFFKVEDERRSENYIQYARCMTK